MSISLTLSRILTLFFTDVLLGIHLVTLSVTIWIQLWKNPARGLKTKWLLVAVPMTMGLIGTFDAVLDVVLNVEVWTSGDLGKFTDRASWINIMKIIDQFVQTLIGDAILVYRCWVVYDGRIMVIIASSLMWMATFVLSMLVIVRSAAIDTASGINDPSLKPYITSVFTLTVALNIITTSLIILRIMRIGGEVRQYIAGHRKMHYAIRIIVESGLLYTLTAFVMLVTVVTKTNADYIPADSLIQVTGIAFDLMIIRFDNHLNKTTVIESAIRFSCRPGVSGLSCTMPSTAPAVPIQALQETSLEKGSHSKNVSV
ncbi:hypothetical protein CERSUDRAFT_88299 [Gelatoporia subvermispora B]|uniref:Uncharacterized protein n=1 Tax=Ceriporiopsis subvermispora (strain B) TaxID=914234 RepID=M2Q626_CERS8|nr:hypothetical protein CERSUDRAFT_88299 [Gelatoporia subvermispora B]